MMTKDEIAEKVRGDIRAKGLESAAVAAGYYMETNGRAWRLRDPNRDPIDKPYKLTEQDIEDRLVWEIMDGFR